MITVIMNFKCWATDAKRDLKRTTINIDTASKVSFRACSHDFSVNHCTVYVPCSLKAGLMCVYSGQYEAIKAADRWLVFITGELIDGIKTMFRILDGFLWNIVFCSKLPLSYCFSLPYFL